MSETAATTTRAWLERFTADEDHWLRYLTGVFRDNGNLIASDGSILVAVPDDGSEAEDKPDRLRALPAIMAQLETPGERVPFRMEALREWLGPHETMCEDCTPELRDGACENCRGTGEVECECFDCGHTHNNECKECGGKGGYLCIHCDNEGVLCAGYIGETDRVSFRGVRLNRRRLAYLLDGAPGENCTIARQENAERALIVEGGGWKALVMPLRQDDDIACPELMEPEAP